MGARPMRRCIQNLIEDPISEKIISGDLKPNSKIIVSSENGEIKLDIKRASNNMAKV
jgi:ATP-dependent Clp protease ATP-binding subunit ClpA